MGQFEGDILIENVCVPVCSASMLQPILGIIPLDLIAPQHRSMAKSAHFAPLPALIDSNRRNNLSGVKSASIHP